jgi:hypothetical protein
MVVSRKAPGTEWPPLVGVYYRRSDAEVDAQARTEAAIGGATDWRVETFVKGD